MTGFMKGAMILTIAGLLVKVIGAISKVIVARILGGEGVGLYQMAYSLYQLIISIGAAGLPVAISIMVARKVGQDDIRGARHIFKVALITMGIIGSLLSLTFYGAIPYIIETGVITDSRAEGALVAVAPAIVIVSILACFRGYFQGFQNMLPTGISQVCEQLARVIVMVGAAMYFLPQGIELASSRAALSSSIGVTLGLLVLLYYYKRETQTIVESAPLESPKVIIKELILLAFPVAIANIMIPLIGAIDLWLVPQQLMLTGYGKEEATTAFGYLTGMATSLISLPVIVTMSLATSLVPAISRLDLHADLEEIHHRMETALRMTNLVTIPAFVGLCVLATPISMMMFNTPHAGGAIAVLSASIWLLGLQQITTGALQGLGRTALPMWTLLLGAAVKVLLNLYLTPLWGIEGAAWATNVDFGLAAFVNVYVLYRIAKFHVSFTEIGKILFSSLAMGGGTAMVYNFISTMLSNTIAVVISILVGIIFYVVALSLTKTITLQELVVLGKKTMKKGRSS